MAVYKVPQNVEAEDKLLGPFTFKQFIFLILTAVAILIAWLLAKASIWLIIPVLPFIIVFGVLGVYHREDQPVETYLLAAINFVLKPHKRVWDNEGIVEGVHLIAPKKKVSPKLKNLATEHGQLESLAHIMDTRGWYTKRPELSEPLEDRRLNDDDRLVVPEVLEEPLDVHTWDDQQDMEHYPAAAHYAELAASSKSQALSKAKTLMNEAKQTGQPKTAEESKTIKYNPYPTRMNQITVEPATGKRQSRTTPSESKVNKVVPKATPKPPPKPAAAKKAPVVDKDGGIPLGEGQEIDLPN